MNIATTSGVCSRAIAAVVDAVREVAPHLDISEIRPDDELVADLGLDSFDVHAVTAAAASSLGLAEIEINLDESVCSVADLAALVAASLDEGSP